MRVFVLILATSLSAYNGLAMAKCFPDTSARKDCRYPQGDSWCAEQAKGKPYAYSDTCLAAPAGTASLPSFAKRESYASVRDKMLKAGWEPFHAQDADECDEGDARCEGRPEMSACAGTGSANCKFLWRKNGKITAICTVGEENAVYDGICSYP